jgi:hypothetical protein
MTMLDLVLAAIASYQPSIPVVMPNSTGNEEPPAFFLYCFPLR